MTFGGEMVKKAPPPVEVVKEIKEETINLELQKSNYPSMGNVGAYSHV